MNKYLTFIAFGLLTATSSMASSSYRNHQFDQQDIHHCHNVLAVQFLQEKVTAEQEENPYAQQIADANFNFYSKPEILLTLERLMDQTTTKRDICTRMIWTAQGAVPFNRASRQEQNNHSYQIGEEIDDPIPLISFVVRGGYNYPIFDFSLLPTLNDSLKNNIMRAFDGISEFNNFGDFNQTNADIFNAGFQNLRQNRLMAVAEHEYVKNAEKKSAKEMLETQPVEPCDFLKLEKTRLKHQKIRDEKTAIEKKLAFFNRIRDFFDDIIVTVRQKGQLS